MTTFSKAFEPFLTPEDLGLELEEDSQDFTEEEARSSVEASSRLDYQQLILDFASRTYGPIRFELKRKAGKNYSRITSSGEKLVLNLPQGAL